MCRLYTLRAPRNILAGIFGVEFPVLDKSLFRTTNTVVAVRRTNDQREAATFHWGLIPPKAKDKKEASGKVNARADTVAELSSYRVPFRRRRCLMPADGFYEYKEIGKKREPHYFEMADGALFAFAGIWEIWSPKDQPAIESCSMITTEPNELVGQFHDRMPVILPRETWDHWLSETEDANELTPLLVAYPSELMREQLVDSPLKKATPKVRTLFD